MSEKSKFIKQSVSLPSEVVEWLRKKAADNHTSVSRLVQDALRAYRSAGQYASALKPSGSVKEGPSAYAAGYNVKQAVEHLSKEFDIPEQDCWDCLMDAVKSSHAQASGKISKSSGRRKAV